MKNNKNRNRIRYILPMVILAIIILILVMIIRLADWYREAFADMAFSIVVCQLTTPMTGTAQEIMQDVMKKVVLYSLVITAVIVSVLVIVRSLKYKWSRIICRLLAGCTIIVLLAMVGYRAYAVGIPEYIDEITHSSTIYEEKYVETADVNITFPERPRNLIYIYAESMEASYADVESGGLSEDNYIPELTRIANENINFSSTDKLGGFHVYGIGFTMAGILASSAGINYKFGVTDSYATIFSQMLPGATTLGDILESQGYDNYFQCGSDASFAARDIFFTGHGDYHIYDLAYAQESGYIPADYHNGFWGYEDIYLFEIAKEELTKIAAEGRPFNYTLLTVDTHNPAGYICERCENKYESQYANAIACSDRQISEFLEWIQSQDWYENTTVVIMGDHTTMADNFRVNANKYDFDAYSKEVYDCFINCADGLDTSHVKNREFSTCDMFPTILAAMGADIEGDRLGLGTNLFSGKPTLPEEMGRELFYEELQKNSKFYTRHLIEGE